MENEEGVEQILDFKYYGDGKKDGARKKAEDGLVDLFLL